MNIREAFIDYSKGDNLAHFWNLYKWQCNAKNRLLHDILKFLMCRCAHRHGGYIGPGAVIDKPISLPHGLHGIYISRYAVVGANCRIYQNVTIGEVDGCAPVIGHDCLIGAGAVIVGNIKIGSYTKIGAGAVVSSDIPESCTVVSQPPRIIAPKEINPEEERISIPAPLIIEKKV